MRRVTKIFRSLHRFLRHARAWGAKKQHTCYTRATVASEPFVNQMRRGNDHVKASRKTFKNINARFHTFHRMGASQEREAFFNKLSTLLVVTRHPIRHEIRHQIRKLTQKSCRPKMGGVAAPKNLPTENSPCPLASRFIVARPSKNKY